MFVLVVDTSLHDVSIAAVSGISDDVSSVQAAIALERSFSAAFILIGSKVGDLIGAQKAYVLGLLGYASGARETITQGLTLVIICWAVIGGLGRRCCCLPCSPSSTGTSRGAQAAGLRPGRRRRRHRRRGRAAAGRFHHDVLVLAVGFALEVVSSPSCWSGIGLVRDAPYTGDRHVDVLGVHPVGGREMGGPRAQHPGVAGRRRGGRRVADRGRDRHGNTGLLADATQARGKATLIDPDLFKSKMFRFGITGQMMQQIALGGMMIVLPIYLQMVLEYAHGAGLSMAPLSLSMFGIALLAGKRAGTRRQPASSARGSSS